jgi:AcrR family transcriptional regulator
VTRGRPREFDIDEALDHALNLFWRKGYEGTSMSDLTDAIGVRRPSLYAAFGNKEALFLNALDRYDAGPASFFAAALRASTARGAVEAVLRGAANLHADAGNPPGCLMVHGALVGRDESFAAREETRRRRVRFREAIQQRLERGKAAGELAAETDCAALAHFFSAVVRGLAIESVGGATGEELIGIVDVAMRAWPELSPQNPDHASERARASVARTTEAL